MKLNFIQAAAVLAFSNVAIASPAVIERQTTNNAQVSQGNTGNSNSNQANVNQGAVSGQGSVNQAGVGDHITVNGNGMLCSIILPSSCLDLT